MKKIICLLLWWNLGFASAWAQGQKVVQFFPLSAADLPAPVAQPARPEPWTGREPGPVSGLRVFAREPSGAVWLGGDEGAARFDSRATERWDRWQYFYGRRWLADDEVRNIWVDPVRGSRVVWIRTRTGVSRIEWTVRNSHRQDVRWQPGQDRFQRDQLTEVLAPDERPVAKWNSNPYRADGGSGGSGEDDGSYFLLPYWMGRYHGWVE